MEEKLASSAGATLRSRLGECVDPSSIGARPKLLNMHTTPFPRAPRTEILPRSQSSACHRSVQRAANRTISMPFSLPDFLEISELTASLEDQPFDDAVKEAREDLAWRHYESSGPIGSVILGGILMRKGRSVIKPDLNAITFARRIILDAVRHLEELPEKTSWDWYHIGVCYRDGLCTLVDHELAAMAFWEAERMNNAAARYEAVWSSLLSQRMSYAEAIEAFPRGPGPSESYAKIARASLSILSEQCTWEIGSSDHIRRIIRLTAVREGRCHHQAGQQYLLDRVHQILESEIEALKRTITPRNALALYWIECGTGGNRRTGSDFEEWFALAIDPENEPLLDCIRSGSFSFDELDTAYRICEEHGWQETTLFFELESKMGYLD